jgi:hypothetical protein
LIAVSLVDDLMFASRVAEAARAQGVEVRRARTADEVRDGCGGQDKAVVFVDLDRPPLPLADIVEASKACAQAVLVGFFSHVEPARGREARSLGFTRVLPRSAFVKELPELLG